ncbi:MAG: GNAT family N-acetyltransferase [Pedococcus sp.]
MLFESRTARLTLRRPTLDDVAFYVAVHSDERLYAHAPHVRVTDLAVHEADLCGWLAAWEEHGFGYWLVEETETGMPVGFAGVRPADGFLNLYYRFAAEAHGRGFAREVSREAVALAAEWLPGTPVQALVKEHNVASVRTALSAGLVRVGARVLSDDAPDEPASTVFEAPQLGRVEALGDAGRSELLDLWTRVNDAGGSVGFLPGAPRRRVAEALATHETQMATGDAVAGALREPDGRLVGWAWWVRVPNPLLHHGRWLYRVMVDPARQRRGLGRLLMAGMHRLAREDGVELLQLGVRSGSGASAFYAQCGYTEVGRIPGAIRVAPGDDRDDVTMARRVDGRPLVAHGGR